MPSGVYPRKKKPVEERFWAKVDKRGPNECWKWTAAKMFTGYGEFRVDGKMLYAHRVSWELHNGPIPGGMCVLHICDNRACVNPAHLWFGTYADNMQDMERKGRCAHPHGEANGKAKFTRGEVRGIRRLLALGLSQRAIARKHNVGHSAIWSIKIGRTWGWLED